MKRQMVVRVEGKDFSAVSDIKCKHGARVSCMQQIQILIYNELNIIPTEETLRANITRFVTL